MPKRAQKEHVCQACGAVFLSGAANAKWCPECRPAQYRAAIVQWQATEHGQKVMREAERRYREEHPEKAREYARRSYARRREKVLGWMKEYRLRNRDVIRERQRRAYREKNRGLVLEKKRLSRLAQKGDSTAAFELLKLKGKVEECPRLRCRMPDLPCGRRRECWDGKVCERATSKGCKRPANTGFGRLIFD